MVWHAPGPREYYTPPTKKKKAKGTGARKGRCRTPGCKKFGKLQSSSSGTCSKCKARLRRA
jgi:hypothetical protein